MLSMLRQMLLEDKAESVRQAVTRSLSIIVAFTDDENKFKQVLFRRRNFDEVQFSYLNADLSKTVYTCIR